MKCLQCKSTRITERVRAVDHGHGQSTNDLSLQTYKDRHAIFFKGATSYSMHANVCADCGFVMFFVGRDDASRLYEARGRDPQRS